MTPVINFAKAARNDDSALDFLSRTWTERNLDDIPHLAGLPAEVRRDMRAVANVLPFRVNGYVLDNLIDWDNLPEDPVFQLLFPQPGMLFPEDLETMRGLIDQGAGRAEIEPQVWAIRDKFNPHPAGQMTLNVPALDGQQLRGMQHKYRETVLFFPARGQTCHAYCTFCYRWAQFTGDQELKFAAESSQDLGRYLARHTEVSDLLLTGGDPLIMKARHLEAYLEPLLKPGLEHVSSVRIGSKTLTYWPWRFIADPDSDDLLRLFERLNESGRQVALMAHFNHWRELEPPVVAEAVRRIRDTGTVIRCQGPLLRHINDDADVWARLWPRQVSLGMIPYYMFVERDTGARHYFETPLHRVSEIFRDAFSRVSGLSRTVRGPSMSAGPGKVEIRGTAEVAGKKVFVLRFLQGRDADWVDRPFFAEYDEKATWLDDLKPAFGEEKFFWQDGYEALCSRAHPGNDV